MNAWKTKISKIRHMGPAPMGGSVSGRAAGGASSVGPFVVSSKTAAAAQVPSAARKALAVDFDLN